MHVNKNEFYELVKKRLLEYSPAIIGRDHSSGIYTQMRINVDYHINKLKELDLKNNLFSGDLWGYGINSISDGSKEYSSPDVEQIKQINELNKHHKEYRLFWLLTFKVESGVLFISIFCIDPCRATSNADLNTKFDLKDFKNARIRMRDRSIYVDFLFDGIEIPIHFQIDTSHKKEKLIGQNLAKYYIEGITELANAIEQIRNIPEKIVVLFLASNPIDQVQLRLDEEARSISEMIKMSKHRDSVRFETCWAVQTKDILQAINEYNPSIVHFSGHGSSNDEIIFQTNSGQTKVVSKEAIVQTMMASSEDIRLVFFNTCYSRNQAKAVVEHIEATIGMNTSIGDEGARIFSSQFYSSIGYGLSVKKSFEQAKALLMLENIPEEDTPELFIHEGLSGKDIIIVKPVDE